MKIGNKIKNIDPGCFLFFGIVGIVVSLFMPLLAMTGNNILFMTSIGVPIVSFISFAIGAIGAITEKNNDKAAHVANINAFQEEYDEYVDKMGIVKSDTQVTLFELGKYDFVVEIPHYFWSTKEYIKFFPMAKYYINNRTSSMSRPDISELKLKSIPIDSILYFEEVGELRKYTTVSGGGSSLKGASLGYAIAEDVGAIIGSREPVTTNVVSEDDRRIELIYKNTEGGIENLEFKHDAYNVFKKLIPLKELRKIISLNTIQGAMDTNTIIDKQKTTTVKEKLKQLNELKAEELITEEEFSEQKKKLLESI